MKRQLSDFSGLALLENLAFSDERGDLKKIQLPPDKFFADHTDAHCKWCALLGAGLIQSKSMLMNYAANRISDGSNRYFGHS